MDEVTTEVTFRDQSFVLTAGRSRDDGNLWRAAIGIELNYDFDEADVTVAGPWAPWDGHPLKDAGFVTYKECLGEAVRVILDNVEPDVPVPVSRAIPS